MKRQKTVMAYSLLAAISSANVIAEEAVEEHQLSGNLALTSDYIWRGISQTDNGPAPDALAKVHRDRAAPSERACPLWHKTAPGVATARPCKTSRSTTASTRTPSIRTPTTG